nr:extracellular solute-binding protein [Spirochaetota bacterium]
VDNSYDITDIGLDNEGALAGANFIKKLVDEMIVNRNSNNLLIESIFKEGIVAMIMDGPWDIKSYRETVPGTCIANLPIKPFVGSRGIMINQISTKQSQSFSFIKDYFSGYTAQMIMYNNGLRPPSRKDAAIEVKKIDPEYSSIYNSIENGELIPNVKATAVVFSYGAGMIDKFKTGLLSVEDAVKTACQSIRDEIMAKYDRYE